MVAQIQILDEISARLANIKTTNGYFADVISVERAKLTPFQDHDLPAVNYWPVSDQIIERLNGKNKHALSITIELHNTTRDDPFTDLAFQHGADIVTALFRDPASPNVADPISKGLGGLINAIEIESITPMIGQGQTPFCGVIVAINALYKTVLADPYTIVV